MIELPEFNTVWENKYPLPGEPVRLARGTIPVIENVDQIYEGEIQEIRERTKALILPESGNYFFSFSETPLVGVHATDFYPQNNTIRPGGPSLEKAGRRTIHFSLNCIASAAGPFESKEDIWTTKKYYIIAPLADLLETNQAIGGVTVDFFFAKQVNLPETAKIFGAASEAKKYIERIGKLRPSGQDSWANVGMINDAGGNFFKKMGLWGALHSHHWTADYEDLISRGVSHKEAIRVILKTEAAKSMGYGPGHIQRVKKEMGFFGEVPSLHEKELNIPQGNSDTACLEDIIVNGN